MRQRILHGLKKMGWEQKILFYGALISVLPLSAFLLAAPQTPSGPSAAAASVDTLIPRGFVLVPIEVQNYEALDSILGRFGVVDLFQAGTAEVQSQRLVARNVRLLRAPQNPTHFAVLIREHEVHQVLKHGGLFSVVVKRPEAGGTEFVKTRKRRTILFEGE